MVVVTPRRAAPPKRRGAPKGPSKGKHPNPHVDKYAMALVHPFDPSSVGVKYPEPYAVPTTAYKITIPLQVNTDSSGNWDACVHPHPLLPVYSTFPSTSSSTGIVGGASQTAPYSLDATFTSAIAQGYFNAGASAASISAKYKNYRVVAMGVRIKTNVDFTHANGRIFWARVASPSQLPGTLSSGATAAGLASCMEVPLDASGHITSQIVDMQEAGELQVSELLGPGGHEFIFHPSSAQCESFIDSNNLYPEQGLANSTATGTVGTTSSSYFSTAGHMGLWLKGEGCVPTSTLGNAPFTLEVIMHLEGTQNLSGGTSAPDLVPASADAARAAPGETYQAQLVAAAAPIACSVGQKAIQAVKDKASGLFGALRSKVSSALSSKFGQMAMSAGKALGLALI